MSSIPESDQEDAEIPLLKQTTQQQQQQQQHYRQDSWNSANWNFIQPVHQPFHTRDRTVSWSSIVTVDSNDASRPDPPNHVPVRLPVRKFFTMPPQSKPLVKLQSQPPVPLQSESTLLSHVSLDRSDNSGRASFDSADTENNVGIIESVGIIDIIDNNVAKNINSRDPRETPDSMYLSHSSEEDSDEKYGNQVRQQPPPRSKPPLATSNTPRTRTSPRRSSQTRKSSKPTLTDRLAKDISHVLQVERHDRMLDHVLALNSNVSPTTDIQYYHDKNHAFLKNEKQNLSQFSRADYGSTQERHSHDTSLKRPNASERRQKRKLVEKLRRKMERKALKHIVKKQAQYSSSESSIESFFSSSSSSSSSSLDDHTRYHLARNQLIEQ